MLSSLLKVVGVSLLSSLMPLKSVDSSVVHTDLLAEKGVNKKQAVIISSSEVKVTFEDLNSGFFDNIFNSINDNFSYSSNFTVKYSFDGVTEYSIICNHFTFDDGTNESYPCAYFDDNGQYFTLEFSVKALNVYEQYPFNFGDYTPLSYIKFGSASGGNASLFTNNFFNPFKDYIYENTQIYINSNYLNNIIFYNFSEVIRNNYSYIVSNSLASYDDTWLGIQWNDGSLVFIDEFEIDLSCNGSNLGRWFYNGLIKMFDYDFIFQIGDTSLYNQLYSAFQRDLGSGIANTPRNKFSFNYRFNYNAPYFADLESYIIEDNFFDSSNIGYDNGKIIDIYLNYFESNNEVYNVIRLKYVNAYHYWIPSPFIEGKSQITSYGYGFFREMKYVNTSTNRSKVVYNRVINVEKDATNINTYSISSDGTWVNSAYRDLGFYLDYDFSTYDDLTNLNNNSLLNGVSSVGGNVDLRDSFSLINTGLGGLVSLLGVNILPGISLGALILVPFAVSLLLFVIMLFKR